ncbi:MAG: hypothetical protein MJ057_01590 [Sphaerochaetaceae bacterium]|nr:hypothetical protein [Sphaerochaetaceae bacterium]
MEQEMINEAVGKLNLRKFLVSENYLPFTTYKAIVVSAGMFEGLYAEGKSETSAINLLNSLIYKKMTNKVA